MRSLLYFAVLQKGEGFLEVLSYLLTGASAAAVIKLIDNLIQWHLKRKAAKEDKNEAKAEERQKDKEQWIENTDKSIQNITNGMRVLLLDRIQYLGQVYIRDGEIDFDDRHRLNEMHGVYHNGLGGNGDLDVLMKEVNELPLKKKG